MGEWQDEYNPFNSWKALVHADRFEAILNKNPKPPVVVNIDLTNACNYRCDFCMFGGQRKRTDPAGMQFRAGNASLPKGYSLVLPPVWKKWGVKSVCLGGGGEPGMHPDCREFIEKCGESKLELGFVTNGYFVNDRSWWETINKNAKFVGFSVDAGNAAAYSGVKGVKPDYFYKVLKNLEGIAKTREELGTNLQIGYKFLLDRKNWRTIYQAAEVASKIGVNHFQFRPAIDPDYGFFRDKLDKIWGQIESAQKDFNREDFHVYGISHKFNPDLSKKNSFEKCRANMLTTTWCADGKVYLCGDTRGNKWSYLINHYPDPGKVIKYWGSPEHLEKAGKIDISKCDRCTLGPYNEVFEQVFIEDKMDRNMI